MNPLSRWRKRLHCPHSRLYEIYVGYWRLQCMDCWAYLDGPVGLAEMRHQEWHLDQDAGEST